jgi:hypothetical protein
MATSFVQNPVDERHSLSVVRLLVTGAVTSAVIFVLCWIGTFIPYTSPSHAYIGLFTNAEISSVRALIEGGLWSVLFGGFAVALFALVYNSVAGFARR